MAITTTLMTTLFHAILVAVLLAVAIVIGQDTTTTHIMDIASEPTVQAVLKYMELSAMHQDKVFLTAGV